MNVGGILSILFEVNGNVKCLYWQSHYTFLHCQKNVNQNFKKRNYKFNLKIYRAKHVFKVCFRKLKLYMYVYM